MALSLDDKLLGEKTQYYCSSSEDEEDGALKFIPDCQVKDKIPIKKHACNTGPKGVVADWRQFKQLESEKREEQESERLSILKKLSLTCRSHLDDEREKQQDERLIRDEDFLEDSFLSEYRKKRIEEMRQKMTNSSKFGFVVSLSSESFVPEIDKEKPNVTVIVHVYEENENYCKRMEKSLAELARLHQSTKFCKIQASQAKLSHSFSRYGVPAFLIYKNGELVGNFVQLSSELDEEFSISDVEGFLIEHGFLSETQGFLPNLSIIAQGSTDDSD